MRERHSPPEGLVGWGLHTVPLLSWGISLKDIKVDGEILGQKFPPFLMVMERDFRGRVAYYAQLPDKVASLSSAKPPCPNPQYALISRVPAAPSCRVSGGRPLTSKKSRTDAQALM
jgi:hypothetical protein